MQIYEKLKQDHNQIRDILKALYKTDSSERRIRSAKFEELDRLVRAHYESEEDVFYGRLRDFNDNNLQTQLEISSREHEEVRDMLDQLRKTPTNSIEWHAHLDNLKKNLELYMEEEEADLFRLAANKLSQDEGERMSVRMEVEEEILKQQSMV